MELPTPLIGNMAHDHQPRKFQFPQREFGKTSIVKRSFQQHGLIAGLGCTMMKTKMLFVHCCLPEQSAHCLEENLYFNRILQLERCHCQNLPSAKHEGSQVNTYRRQVDITNHFSIQIHIISYIIA